MVLTVRSCLDKYYLNLYFHTFVKIDVKIILIKTIVGFLW